MCVQTQCQDLRKRKNLELQILSEPVRAWEGEGIKSLGSVAYMSQVHMRTGSSEVRHSQVRTESASADYSYLQAFYGALCPSSPEPK